MYDEYDADLYAVRDPAPPTRNVLALRVGDLLSPQTRAHRRRAPLVINGETIKETFRERLERESRELETAVTQLAGQLARRTEQLEHLNRFPVEDPFQNGDTIQFEKSFPNSPSTYYSYAAHRAVDRWFVTGDRSPNNITWDELVSWMGLGVNTVWLMPRTASGRRKKVIG